MSDDKPPPQPTTVAMPAVPAWAIDLTTTVKDGFREVNARLSTVEGNLDLQKEQGVDLGKRMTSIEERVGKVEDRANTGSLRVKQERATNLQQDAPIATILTDASAIKAEQEQAAKRDGVTDGAIAENTAITVEFKRTLLSGVRHPAFLALLMAAIVWATTWLGRHS